MWLHILIFMLNGGGKETNSLFPSPLWFSLQISKLGLEELFTFQCPLSEILTSMCMELDGGESG